MNQVPLSIGLPVWNGENYLRECLHALQHQTYADFELIISDNGSTDATPDICSDAARRDPRIRYIRQKENLGAAGNFDFVLHESRGELFRWTAHDDLIQPTYLQHCVSALREHPDAVLAHSETHVIDSKGRLLPRGDHPDLYDPADRALDAPCPRIRFEELVLRTGWCFEIFGVMPRKLVLWAGGHQSFYGSDKVLLSRLAVIGRLVTIPEPLFLRRNHPATSTGMKSSRERAAWINPTMSASALQTRFCCLQGYVSALLSDGATPDAFAGGMWVVLRYLLQVNKWAGVLGISTNGRRQNRAQRGSKTLNDAAALAENYLRGHKVAPQPVSRY